MISTNQFRNGTASDVDGTIYKIVECQHVKPGKGGAFVRTKLRRASDGNVIDKTFRAGEKFRDVRTEARKMQFLYADGSDAHFMDTESFEQIAVPEATIASALRWCAPLTWRRRARGPRERATPEDATPPRAAGAPAGAPVRGGGKKRGGRSRR